MPNTNNTMKAFGLIAKQAAKQFKDNLGAFTGNIAVADEADLKGKNGYGPGDTITISKPARYVPVEGNFNVTSSIRDSVEETTSLRLDVLSSVPIEVNSLELAYEVDIKSYYNRYISPAVNALAHNVEAQMITRATRLVPNAVGTPGSTVFDTDTILAARERMGKFLCPRDNKRYFAFDSTAGRSAVNARKGLFQSSSEIDKQYKMGMVGEADGFKWFETEMLVNHTNGNDVTSVLINGTISEGASALTIDGLTNTTGTVTAGSVFTVAGVFAVHPITKQVQPFLQQFTVLPATGGGLTYTANGSGQATVNVYPSLFATATDGRRTVGALPADNAALTFIGTENQASLQNLAFHRDAFRMISVPLYMPKNVEMSVQESYEGVNVAIVQAWDQLQRRLITRVDFLGGICADRPEWACRIYS